MMKELRRISLGILSAFMLIALSATYWGVIGAEGLRQREDNPRLIEAEVAIRRGNIYDRQGILLATTTVNYNGEGLRRLYPHPEVAPAVGYYSLRFGTSGVEATYDDVLRGEAGQTPFAAWWRDLLHLPAVGGDVRLTLDLAAQRAAMEALDGQAGAVVVATVPDGAIRAMASAPIFNPNFVDENWAVLIQAPGAPLLNRVTQGVYQPGGVLQTALLATAISWHVNTTTPLADAATPVQVNDLRLSCGRTPPVEDLTFQQAYVYACPRPFTQLIIQLSPEVIDEALWRFGLLTPPHLLGLNIETRDSPLPLAILENQQAQTAALAGQGTLTITPLQALDMVAAIANAGNAPRYTLIDAIRLPGTTTWEPVRPPGVSRAVLTRQTASQMQQVMQIATSEGVAAAAQAESTLPVMGHAATAFSGPGATPLQWFIGMVGFDDGTAIIAAVVLEDAPSPEQAARVGGRVLEATAQALALGQNPAP